MLIFIFCTGTVYNRYCLSSLSKEGYLSMFLQAARRPFATLALLALTVGVAITPTIAHPSKAEAVSHKAYTFIVKKYKGKLIVQWSKSTPIKYSIRTAHSYKGFSSDVHWSLKQVSKATGLRFKQVKYNSKNEYANGVLLTFKKVGHLSGELGRGGLTYSYYISGGEAHSMGAHSMVKISTIKNHHLRKHVLLHELGHAMGLGHVSHKSSVMYPYSNKHSPIHYSKADITGLRKLTTK